MTECVEQVQRPRVCMLPSPGFGPLSFFYAPLSVCTSRRRRHVRSIGRKLSHSDIRHWTRWRQEINPF